MLSFVRLFAYGQRRTRTVIFNIQRFSTHDGAGIRTIIFLKGCSLHCPWCENPESQSFKPELGWDAKKCIGCLECARAARDGEMEVVDGKPVFHRGKITDPERLADACSTGALAVLGEDRSVAEILKEVQKDIPFYEKSGGGATISGGEPFDQPVFLLELLQAIKGIGVTTAIETTLSVPWSAVEPCLPFVDTFLVDFKHADAAGLKEVTGADLSRIAGNLRKLEAADRPVIARVPIVPGFNDSSSEIADIVALAASFSNIRTIHFLPFHTLGVGKYHLLGKDYRFPAQAGPARDMSGYLTLARGKGLEAITGG
jgi:pyruvate formate lyase activating enzyme